MEEDIAVTNYTMCMPCVHEMYSRECVCVRCMRVYARYVMHVCACACARVRAMYACVCEVCHACVRVCMCNIFAKYCFNMLIRMYTLPIYTHARTHMYIFRSVAHPGVRTDARPWPQPATEQEIAFLGRRNFGTVCCYTGSDWLNVSTGLLIG